MQSKSGETLSRDEIKIGDILSFDTTLKGHINHSGIYIGNGEFIHSSSGKAKGVTVSKLDKGFYKDKFRWGVRVK
jgi:cell wall-associated NlpC family hydrolase